MRIFLRASLLLSLLFLAACQKMDATEYGVRFRRLPPFLFGGIAERVVSPGETTFLMPWDSIYRFDTSVKDLSWGRSISQQPAGGVAEDYVHTRALDGNEVALAMTVRYRVAPDPQRLRLLVERVATDNSKVEALVAAVARADMRTYMNRLSTDMFLDEQERYGAVDAARASMERRLSALGIEILRVNLDDFRFERLLKDGTLDTSYQDKLTEIQRLHQDTERERSRIETVRAKKLQERNNALAIVNRQVAEAQGYKDQALLRGDGYFDARSNEAEGVLAVGKAQVTGIIEQINALSGPGGEAILKLDLARELVRAQPRFILLPESTNPSSLEVKRVDTNELLRQIGVLEGLQKDSKAVSDTRKSDVSAVSKAKENAKEREGQQ